MVNTLTYLTIDCFLGLCTDMLCHAKDG